MIESASLGPSAQRYEAGMRAPIRYGVSFRVKRTGRLIGRWAVCSLHPDGVEREEIRCFRRITALRIEMLLTQHARTGVDMGVRLAAAA